MEKACFIWQQYHGSVALYYVYSCGVGAKQQGAESLLSTLELRVEYEPVVWDEGRHQHNPTSSTCT